MTDSAIAGTRDVTAVARRRWTLPSFGQASFALVFLGLPLAVYVIFVILPIVQAFYYSLTDWGGFSKKMNFVGFDNYLRLLQDGVFLKA
ncbi:MAG: sugar transporter permease, partial [Aeromicrobium sp.]|nr:sugar transporter permease [Aeromicrobium sp.]